MKITICCSLAFMEEVKQVRNELQNFGHQVLLPETILECEEKNVASYKELIQRFETEQEWSDYKKGRMLLHFDKVKQADAILVCNYKKNEIEHYIGPNTFLEMALALYFNKPIYLLNPIPENNYLDEITAMQPIVINQDLSLIC